MLPPSNPAVTNAITMHDYVWMKCKHSGALRHDCCIETFTQHIITLAVHH